MSFENETFRKAAGDAGIEGSDWKGEKAIQHFSDFYHDKYPDKWEREGHGYHGILEIARSWWDDNKHKYS